MQGLRMGDVWCFGHTHFSTEFMLDEVRVVSNQLGDREGESVGFDMERVFEM